ncbi:MAG TPA: Asp-tRNA(Asn)/Glu-tRNA(Gln) amidotransferase subunit GatC [Thermoanaerobacterales bacterium]|nr:Asp-tRNA(Asn)/Glu-tRNA(Gln) amidotransferase subunit GatC [Thermoanaerobacterales bacterium]
MNKDTVERIADVAHVHISEEEKSEIAKKLSFLLECFDKLNQVDTEGVMPTVYPVTDRNVLREDVVWESLPIQEVLKNASDKDNRFFRVPRIIEE